MTRRAFTLTLIIVGILVAGIGLGGCLGRISSEDLATARQAAQTAQQRVEDLDAALTATRAALAEAKAAAVAAAQTAATVAPEAKPQADAAAAKAVALADGLSARLDNLQAMVPVARDLAARATTALTDAEKVSRDGGDGLDVIITGIGAVLGLGAVGERIVAIRKAARTRDALVQTVAAVDALDAENPAAAATLKVALAPAHDEASRVEIRKARLHPKAAPAKAVARKALAKPAEKPTGA